MRVLIDECVPAPLAELLLPHECRTAAEMGWRGLRNGELLRQAEGTLDVLVTADQNLRYQQNLAGRSLRVLELSTNNLRRLQAAVPSIVAAISDLEAGDVRRLDVP